MALGAQALDLQHRTTLPEAVAVMANQVASDHQANHGVVVDFLARQFPGIAAVAQNGDAVGQRLHLTETVADVHDAHTLRPQVADHRVEAVGFALAEAGGRLIHDDHPGAGIHGAGDFDELLTAWGKLGDGGVRRYVESDPGEGLGGPVSLASAIEEDTPARFASEEQIGAHVEIVGERKLLMDERDAGAGGGAHAVDADGPPIDQELP